MPKILILFAQAAEAYFTIERFDAQPVSNKTQHVWSEGVIPSYYVFEKEGVQGEIVICNVGIHSAQMSVAHYAPSCDEVWNFGLAGSLLPDHTIGRLLSIQTIGKYVPTYDSLDPCSQECVSSTLPTFTISNEPGGKLISSDFPIHMHEHKEKLANQWDLVDMEGYGIAFACSYLGIPCKLWKIISDFVSPGGRELLRKNRSQLSEQIAQTVEQALNDFSKTNSNLTKMSNI